MPQAQQAGAAVLLQVQAIQACTVALKEAQRKVDSASGADSELKQTLQLARVALSRALQEPKGGIAVNASNTSISSSSFPTASAGKETDTTSSKSGSNMTSPLCGASSALWQSAPLWSVVLSGLFWKKRKLSVHCVTALQQLLSIVPEYQLATYITLFSCINTSAAQTATQTMAGSPTAAGVAQVKIHLSIGQAVFVSLTACLSDTTDASLQVRVLEMLQRFLVHEGGSYFFSKCVTRTVQACFTTALQTSQDTVRVGASQVLYLAVAAVTKTFVMQAVPAPGSSPMTHPGIFATDTLLEDYTVDVEYDAPYTCIEVINPSLSLGPAIAAATSGGAPATGVGSGTAVLFGDTAPWSSSASPRSMTNGARTSPPPPPPLPPAPAAGKEGVTPMNTTGGEVEGKPEVAEQHSHTPDYCDPSFTTNTTTATSLDPRTFFRSSLDDSLVRDALGVLHPDNRLPQPMKDLLALLRLACRLGSRVCSGSATEGNVEVRARLLALHVIERIFDELPVANCEAEHQCATWLSLVLTAAKYELFRCISRSLATIAPFCWFESAVRVVSLLLRKCHYCMSRELHSLLAVFLLPLVASRYCDFRQKHAVLSMIHDLFSVPHVVMSFFINYDCNPAFDAGGKYGGMLELLIDFVSEMVFMDYVEEDDTNSCAWLTSDQQQLLRSECIVSLHTLVSSMYRWIAEDPQAYALDAIHKHKARGGGGNAKTVAKNDEWSEMYLDNWDTDNDEEEDTLREDGAGHGASGIVTPHRADSDGGSTVAETESSFPGYSLSQQGGRTGVSGGRNLMPLWGKNRNIYYHWKHVHYLLHNKQIAQEAVQLINSGKWKDAKALLESRQYFAKLPVPEAEEKSEEVEPGMSSYANFAKFLYEYPDIDRGAISAIFERVNKPDRSSRLVLMEYLHQFKYVNVPIDMALRNTTCKFMSWDRPMFEAQVWETIQTLFGKEYARQNPQSITASDADTMTGVLLFLHSSLHNESARSGRMSIDTFAQDGNACLDFPMAEEDIRDMYHRVEKTKWQLDAYGRTPEEAEREGGNMHVSLCIRHERIAREREERRLALTAGGEAATEVSSSVQSEGAGHDAGKLESTLVLGSAEMEDGSFSSQRGYTARRVLGAAAAALRHATPTHSSNSSGAKSSAHAASHRRGDDAVMLDQGLPLYCDNKDTLKLREEHQQEYVTVAAVHLAKLEATHRRYYVERSTYCPQPYIIPHYAEHVRPLLLNSYPQIMACVYMGIRVLEAAPASRQLLDTIQMLYDIAAAFVVNLGDLKPAIHETVRRYLSGNKAYQLLPPTRATFVPFVLNTI